MLFANSLPQSGASSCACQGRGHWRTTSDLPGGWQTRPCVRALCTPSPICEKSDRVLACGASAHRTGLIPSTLPRTSDLLLGWGDVSHPAAPLWWNAASSPQTAGTGQTPAPCSRCRAECSCSARPEPSRTFLWPKLEENALPSTPLWAFCSTVAGRPSRSLGQLMAFSPSRSPVYICPICRGVSSAAQLLWRFLPCCWLLWWRPASPPCRPCGRTSWQPRATQIGRLTSPDLLSGALPNHLSGHWNALPHLLQLFGPGFLGFPEALIRLFGFSESSHHLFVVRVSLPVLHLLKVDVHQAVFHTLMELAHFFRLRHQCQPRSLHGAVLRTWRNDETGKTRLRCWDRIWKGITSFTFVYQLPPSLGPLR